MRLFSKSVSFLHKFDGLSIDLFSSLVLFDGLADFGGQRYFRFSGSLGCSLDGLGRLDSKILLLFGDTLFDIDLLLRLCTELRLGGHWLHSMTILGFKVVYVGFMFLTLAEASRLLMVASNFI